MMDGIFIRLKWNDGFCFCSFRWIGGDSRLLNESDDYCYCRLSGDGNDYRFSWSECSVFS